MSPCPFCSGSGDRGPEDQGLCGPEGLGTLTAADSSAMKPAPDVCWGSACLRKGLKEQTNTWTGLPGRGGMRGKDGGWGVSWYTHVWGGLASFSQGEVETGFRGGWLEGRRGAVVRWCGPAMLVGGACTARIKEKFRDGHREGAT